MAWHDTKFEETKIWRGWDSPGTNPKCDGWTKKILRMCDSTKVVRVRDLLAVIFVFLDGERRSSWMVRFMDTVYRQVPEEIRRSAVAFIAYNIDRFPTPWTSLPKRYRFIEWGRRTRLINAFTELPAEPGKSLIEVTAQDPSAVGKYRVAIDWSYGDRAIIDNFEKWLLHRRLQKRTRKTAGRPVEPKQRRGSYSIYYTASTGIWQTVWLEPVSEASIAALKIVPDLDHNSLTLTVTGAGTAPADLVDAIALDNGKEVSHVTGPVGMQFSLPLADPKPWSPDNPFLYDLKVQLLHAGQPTDSVASYFGMRKISQGPDEKGIPRIYLNGKILYQLGVLDQGYWPDGLYTAPTDDALRSDIEMVKKFGFNTDRKHMKVEPDRWYYWCDKLGVLVWQDMPAGPGNEASSDDRITDAQAQQFQDELRAMVDGRQNHPSIVQWVLFNESWGQFDTRRLTEWLKAYDPTRFVDSASGWTDFHVGDINDRHNYAAAPEAPIQDHKRASVLGEIGGLGLILPGHLWQGQGGYDDTGIGTDPQPFPGQFAKLMAGIWPQIDSAGLCATIYTQLTDVEKEASGLMTYDRIPKVSPAVIAGFNRDAPIASGTGAP